MNFITNKHQWPSEFTRAYQVASALGCKVNQVFDNYDETLVTVKCFLSPDIQHDMEKFKRYYLDLIDDANLIDTAKKNPTATLIVMTEIMRDFLKNKISNPMVVIPEHHCNFELLRRDRNKVEVAGYVGSRSCFDLDFEVVAKALARIGLNFNVLICEDNNVVREDVVDFYKTIDIQIAFRTETRAIRPPIYRNPLKIFNAGSFGIPTVAYPEIGYRLTAGTYFLEAVHIDSVIDKCRILKDDASLYNFYADRVFEWSKQFDIAKIAKMYAKLAPNENFDIDENVRRMRCGEV